MTIETIDSLILALKKSVPNFKQVNRTTFTGLVPSKDGFLGTDDRWVVFLDSLIGMDNTTRHTDSVENYVKFIPDFPQVNWEKIRPVQRLGLKKFKYLDKSTIVGYTRNDLRNDFWGHLGFSPLTIEKASLGYGSVATSGTETLPYGRGIIPYKYNISNRYGILSLRDDRIDSITPKHIQPRGLAPYFLHLEGDKDTTELYIAEGGKSSLAMYELSHYRPVFSPTNGAGSWKNEWLSEILLMYPSVDTVFIMNDNDEAGRKLLEKIAVGLEDFPITSIKIPVYKESHEVGDDAYDFFKRKESIQWIDHEFESKIVSGVKTSDTKERLTIDYLREFLNKSMGDYIDNYQKDYRNTGRIYKIPTGVGKSYGIIEVLNERIEKHLAWCLEKEEENRVKILNLYSKLPESNDEDAEKIRKKIQRLSKPIPKTYAIIYTPFKKSYQDLKESLGNFKEEWVYDYQGRDENNCENIENASILASKGYPVVPNLCDKCPFNERCKYLSQEEEMKQFPIVIMRHQHIGNRNLIPSTTKVIVVDEDIFPVLSKETRVSVADFVLPSGWSSLLSEDRVKRINDFLTLFKNVLIEGTPIISGYNVALNGKDVWDRIFKQADKLDIDIEDVLSLEDEDMEFIFNIDVDNNKDLPPRFLDKLISMLRDEYHIAQQGLEFTSRISQHGMDLVMLNARPVSFPKRLALIVLDATATELTSMLYERKMHMTDKAAAVKSKIVYLVGAAMGKTYVSQMINRDALGNVRKIIERIQSEHDSMLIITHKQLANLLEKEYPNISVSNFGNVVGKNEWEDIKSLCIIGTPRLPDSTLLMLASAWFSHQKPVKLDREDIERNYYNTDQYLADTDFSDPRVRIINDWYTETELIQSAGRIRPNNTEKMVYFLGQYPAFEDFSTEIIPYREFIKQDIENVAEDFMRKSLIESDVPTIVGTRQVANFVRDKGFSISQRAINSIVQEIGDRLEQELKDTTYVRGNKVYNK